MSTTENMGIPQENLKNLEKEERIKIEKTNINLNQISSSPTVSVNPFNENFSLTSEKEKENTIRLKNVDFNKKLINNKEITLSNLFIAKNSRIPVTTRSRTIKIINILTDNLDSTINKHPTSITTSISSKEYITLNHKNTSKTSIDFCKFTKRLHLEKDKKIIAKYIDEIINKKYNRTLSTLIDHIVRTNKNTQNLLSLLLDQYLFQLSRIAADKKLYVKALANKLQELITRLDLSSLHSIILEKQIEIKYTSHTPTFSLIKQAKLCNTSHSASTLLKTKQNITYNSDFPYEGDEAMFNISIRQILNSTN